MVGKEVGLSDVADYWNRRPCNIYHSPLPIGTIAYFDEVEKKKYLVEPHIPKFANFAKWKNRDIPEWFNPASTVASDQQVVLV